MTANELYNIVREYDQTVSKIDLAYGNGFDKKGKEYFSYLIATFPQFADWVKEKYPEAIGYFVIP